MAGVAANVPGRVGMGSGQTQTINGQDYAMYSPQWYEAMRQNKITNAQTAGTAAGAGAKAAIDALGGMSGGAGGNGAAGASGGGQQPAPMPRIGDSGGGGDYSKFDTGPGGIGASHIAPIDMTAANSAAFGRAKDQVGQQSAGALAGLRSALGGRGMLGSGAEYRGTQGVITKGQGELGEVSRTQAINDVAMSADIAKANQQADLTMRGQDISRRGQNMDYSLGYRSGDITQRGQDINERTSNAQMQMTRSLQEAAQRQQILQGIMGVLQGGQAY